MNILNYVDTFIAVATHQSFTRAAESLAISKGAVSQAIKQLELELNTTYSFVQQEKFP